MYLLRMNRVHRSAAYVGRVAEINEATKYRDGITRGRHRRLKLALIAEFGVCFYCDDPVFDIQPKDGETAPPNQATLDHTVSRFFREKGEEVLKVLCCNRCNQQRSKVENKKYTTEHQAKLRSAA